MTAEDGNGARPRLLDRLRYGGTALAAAAIAIPLLVGLALVERLRTGLRRQQGKSPRLLWGPTPIHSIKYYSEAMQRRGYESRTYVIAPSRISKRSDFDALRDDFPIPAKLEAFRDYRIFAWALRRADVFLVNFDLGILRSQLLKWLEYPLLRLAGKKLIVVAFGGDIAVKGYLGDIEGPLFEDYPQLPALGPLFKRYVDYTARWATLTIHTIQPGYMPRRDVIWPSHVTIDADTWSAALKSVSRDDGDHDEVIVLHAPNHRHIKGTEYFEAAIEQLRQEGLPVRLEILEGVPNDQVRETMLKSDIVADQLLIGYALFAIEGMAAGKPVLTNLSRVPEDVRGAEQVRACPVVDTDPEHVIDDLRRLVLDADERARLGEEGRRFVERFHSPDASGDAWHALIEHAWSGAPLPEGLAATLAPSRSQ